MFIAFFHEINQSIRSLLVCKVAFETMASDLERSHLEMSEKLSQALNVSS
jgi:hypothetical protein